MSRSPLSYSGALSVLGEYEHPMVERINAVAGAGLLVAAPVFPSVLALFDFKNEAIELLKELLEKTIQKVSSTAGRDRQDLIQAAHTILVLSALIGALQEVLGSGYKILASADYDSILFARHKASNETLIDRLIETKIPLPGAAYGFAENMSERLEPCLKGIVDEILAYCEQLRLWEQVPVTRTSAARKILSLSLRKYESDFWSLASRIPDLKVWVSLTEHHVTRTRIRGEFDQIEHVLKEQSKSLAKVHDILSVLSPADRPPRTSNRGLLIRGASSVLSKPLLRAASPPLGISFPTVSDGFITPNFRLATAVSGEPISQREWWDNWPIRRDLDQFLAAHLAHPDSCDSPLIILGHPGAGNLC
jgi:hypothetical protein